jgi:DNA-binding GntR family transcriptional regulator
VTTDHLASRPTGVERRALRDLVYDRIINLLMSGELEPSARLSIDTLARDLEVSPTPVREALANLERTGLVTREALKGYRVAAPLLPEQIAELFDARLVLETGSAGLAERHADELIPELRRAHQNHVEAAALVLDMHGDSPLDVSVLHDYFDADWGFHRAILRRSGNRFLDQMSESLGSHLHRMRQSALQGKTDVDQAVHEHQAILEAFESREPGAGAAAMSQHIELVRRRAIADA